MLRLILFVLVLVLVWILFFSDWSKQRRIGTAIATFLISVMVMWFASETGKPSTNLVQPSQVTVCEFSVAYSYRTNYDLSLCLNNGHPSALITRVEFSVVAEQCVEGECEVLQSVTKSRPVSLASGESLTLTDSMRFENLSNAQGTTLDWRVEILSLQAVNQ